MSRIGNRILTIPENVNIEILENNVTVKGPKGELSLSIPKDVIVKVEDKVLTVEINEENSNDNSNAISGTINSLIENMIEGVEKGYSKGLEIAGVGYRFQVQGNLLTISAGYSHPVKLTVPKGLQVEAASNTEITVRGISKELVGEFAANIRNVRRPEPYKGKGIKYVGEHIRRKEGKKASK
jgi:large subunit ribosomal protein L6